MSERDAIDLRPWGYAPGGYFFRCIDCPPPENLAAAAMGDKRSSRCETHALAAKKADERGDHLPASASGDERTGEAWICEGIPDDVIEAGIEAWEIAKSEMEAREMSDMPEAMTDWDDGMVVAAIYKAMVAHHRATHAGEVERLREALVWYGEQARLARLIHSEGDAGRHALADDGGKRARQALEASR